MILKSQLENQRKQDEIKRQETARLLENQKSKIIPDITPEIIATSSLLPLSIIAYLVVKK